MVVGYVEDNIDPKQEGRLRLRIYGYNDQRDEEGKYLIPTEMLPWATCTSIGAGGNFSIPKIGTNVYVEGNLPYAPQWVSMERLSDAISAELGDDRNAHVVLYDDDFDNGDENKLRKGEHIKIVFTDNKGLVVEYKNTFGTSSITLDNEGGINITNASGDSIVMSNGKININASNSITINAPQVNLGENATEGLLKSETFKKIFESHKHLCNDIGTLSEPPLKGMSLSDCVNLKVMA